MRVKDPESLIRARKRKGYSQRNLAALCGCTQAAISALETGTMRGCSEPLAKVISKWVDRDVEELFTRHETVRMQRVTNAHTASRRDKVSAA